MSRLDVCGTADNHPMVFAYLGPNTEHGASVDYMNRLRQDRDSLCESRKKTIAEHHRSADNEGDGQSTDSEAEVSTKPSSTPASIQSYGELMLDLDNLPLGSPVGWFVGRGYTEPKEFEDRQIDLCLSVEHELSSSVSHCQALFYFHEKSGVLCVKGTSLTNPLVYWVDGEAIRLCDGESHVIMSRTSHFRFGKLELVLRIPEFNAKGYKALLDARNTAMARWNRDSDLPSTRLFAFPQAKPFCRIDQILLHSSVAGGGFGWVLAGVDIKTGEPVAVKEVRVDLRHKLRDLELEIEASLDFKDTRGSMLRGLMQASQVQCEHDCHINTTKLGHYGRAALAFCHHKITKVFFVFPLAITDFHHHDWSNENLRFIATALDDVLEGVLVLHLADWMHLDLTPKNLLLMSTKTAVAKVADFGKAVHAQTATNTYLCPPAYSAPEVDGTPYSNKVDCFNMGLVFCHIILVEEFAEILSLRSDEDDDMLFYYRLDLELEKYGEKGPVQESLADIARGLTAYYPDKRYSIKRALAELPRWDESEKLFKWRSGQTFIPPKETDGSTVPNVGGGNGGDPRPKKKRARKSKVTKEACKLGDQAQQKDEAEYEASDELKHKKSEKVVFSISGRD
ncbi:MAG: hypothetical protein Q9174_004333 [Haloplaca sp. 1 TL-2023]